MERALLLECYKPNLLNYWQTYTWSVTPRALCVVYILLWIWLLLESIIYRVGLLSSVTLSKRRLNPRYFAIKFKVIRELHSSSWNILMEISRHRLCTANCLSRSVRLTAWAVPYGPRTKLLILQSTSKIIFQRNNSGRRDYFSTEQEHSEENESLNGYTTTYACELW